MRRLLPALIALVLAAVGTTEWNVSSAGAQSALGSWAPTAPLSPTRTGHTATLLGNGKVLVAGGQSGRLQDAMADAVLFDPATGTWQPTAPMAVARTGHVATLLPDGKVLVTGGFNRRRQQITPTGPGQFRVKPSFVNEAELYDPATGKWAGTASMPSCGDAGLFQDAGRSAHTATVLATGKVLVAGGQCGGHDLLALKDALLYDLAAGRWGPAAPMEVGRRHHTATLLPDGSVFVAGGYSVDGTPIRDGAVFDPGPGTWAPRSLKVGRGEHTASLLPGGSVLLAGGGKEVEVYDPRTRAATLVGSIAQARSAHSAALFPDGKVLVLGGRDTPPGDPAPHVLASTEIYDPATRRWSSAGSTIKKEYSHRAEAGLPPSNNTATLLSNQPCGTNCGKVLVVGGDSDATSAELYTPAPGPTKQDKANPAPQRKSKAGDVGADPAAGEQGSVGASPEQASATRRPAEDDSGSPKWLVVGLVALLLAGSAALVAIRHRRRRAASLQS